ncbi:uncharacterized protein LOC126745915 [Anthonomus grandis grandis]|uniref:uncharacterized protein LOC126745915 n=1 Tax=Anthonomus grandis grandis TaxID=2921223 RepID=UPI002165497B|nr:uncharacterized protein LOC126745915 [Anthonomus grandis grandis]
MLRNCLILVLVIVAVQSATVLQRNIPVEVRYERLNHNINANLAEQIQLSPEEIKENQIKSQNLVKLDGPIPEATVDHSASIKNLQEKIQLSPEELIQAPKYIPVPDTLNKLKSETTDSESTKNKNLISTIQEYVENRLDGLRNSFIPKANENGPPKELWERFEKDVRKYFEDEKNKGGLRQGQGINQQNIFQNFANGIQQFANNFVTQLQGQNSSAPTGTSGDEGTSQNPFQGFIGYFTGGVQNIVSTIQNAGQGTQGSGNSTVLGDSGSSSQQPGNIFTSFVAGVQQIFQGPQQGINQVLAGNNSQSDTETSTSSSGGNPIQQVIQSFGNIGNAINSFVQGGQNKPQGSEDESSSQAPSQNFIQSIGQNIGNAFQNIQNQFRPPSVSQLPQIPSISSNDSNPIIGQVSNIGNQVQQVAGQAVSNNPLQNLIPGGSSTSSSVESSSDSSAQKNIEEEENANNKELAKDIETSTTGAETTTVMA